MNSPSSPTQSAALPFAVAFLGIAIFSAMDAVMKHLSIVIGAYNAMLWRTIISLVVLAPIFVLRGGRWPERAVFRLHVLRGATAGLSLLLFFWALARVPLAEGIALSFIAPLIALALAAFFLKEKIARSALFASVLAFGGVLVIVAGQPGAAAGGSNWQGQAAILLAAVLYAVSIVAGRRQAQAAGPLEIALFFNIVAGALLLVAAPRFAILPDWTHFPPLILATMAANISIMLIAWAYARAETQYLLPVEYTAFLWAAMFGWLVFGEAVTAATLSGAVLIVAACLLAARSNRGIAHADVHLDVAGTGSDIASDPLIAPESADS
ncbi:MAG TPA: DMT family transporter [Sphingobium sp.]|nr:DMT family transporter [Sphingobium sp.]